MESAGRVSAFSSTARLVSTSNLRSSLPWKFISGCFAVLVLVLGVSGVARGQTVVVTSDGTQVFEDSTIFIDNAYPPDMPDLEVSLNGPCAYVDYQINVQSQYPEFMALGTVYGEADCGVVGVVDWSALPPFLGGSAYLFTDIYDFTGDLIESGEVDFNIGGINPVPSDVDEEASSDGAPWFFRNLITQESSYRQFCSSGTNCQFAGAPTFGPPNGFGLTQIDNNPSPTANDLWDWVINVGDGVTHANGNRSSSISLWDTQLANMRSATGTTPNFAGDYYAGPYCSFDSAGPNGDPVGNYYGYDEGNWINMYNSGKQWITWSTTQWKNTGFGWSWSGNYVDNVCSAPPQ